MNLPAKQKLEDALGYHSACGGKLRVKDWGTHSWLRYEVWCEDCDSCDPNGYGSVEAAIEGATGYFKAIVSPADAGATEEK